MESKTKWSAGMRTIAKTALAHLLPVLRKKLLVDVEGRDVTKYQKGRQVEGASNRTSGRTKHAPVLDAPSH